MIWFRGLRWIKGIFKKRGFIIFVSIEILEGFLVRLSIGSFGFENLRRFR